VGNYVGGVVTVYYSVYCNIFPSIVLPASHLSDRWFLASRQNGIKKRA